MRHLDVQFGPADKLNPLAGYELTIREIGRRPPHRDGDVILHTASDPRTGEPLTSPEDCLEVISWYT